MSVLPVTLFYQAVLYFILIKTSSFPSAFSLPLMSLPRTVSVAGIGLHSGYQQNDIKLACLANKINITGAPSRSKTHLSPSGDRRSLRTSQVHVLASISLMQNLHLLLTPSCVSKLTPAFKIHYRNSNLYRFHSLRLS